MKSLKIIFRWVVLLAVIAGVGWWWLQQQKPAKESDRLVIYGNIDIREVDLAFLAVERIDQMLFWEGDAVKKGQRLASLDKTAFEANVDKVKALLEAQKQTVAKLEAGSRPQEIRQAEAKVKEAETLLYEARRTYKRLKSLHSKNLASQQKLDDALSAVSSAQARLKVAQETLALVREGPRKEDIAAAQAKLQSLDAQRVLAIKQLKDADLYAPADGIIRERLLEPGDMASPQQPVYTLALNDPLWVRAYIPEPSLGKVKLGARASIFTDSFPEKEYQGWVGFISPTAEFTPKNVQTPELRTRLVYQARIFVCNPDNELRLGMPATVQIPLNQSMESWTNDQPPCKETESH